jgi:microcystin-dependent protein
MALTPKLSLPYPTPDDTVDVPRDVSALANAIDPLGVVPVGAMMLWGTAVAPAGWLLANGQQVDSATNPGLAALLGQTAGKVTIPDMRDTFPVGAGPTMALGAVGGTSTVGLTLAQLPAHDHGGKTQLADRSLTHSHTLDTAGQGVSSGSGGGYNGTMSPNSGVSVGATNAAATPDHQHVISAAGGGQAHENRPPFRALNFIMRAG